MMFVPAVAAQLHTALAIAAACVFWGLMILICAGIVKLLAALRVPLAARVVYVVLLLAPCVNVVMLLVAQHLATTALREAGLRVGLTGVRDADLLRVLDRCRCHGCGYSLIGNVSGTCPECGRPTGVGPRSGPTA